MGGTFQQFYSPVTWSGGGGGVWVNGGGGGVSVGRQVSTVL